jgi:hypothetical protein
MQEYRLSRKITKTTKTKNRCLTLWEVPVKGGVRRTGDSRGAECPGGLIHPGCCTEFGLQSFQERSVTQLTTQMRLVTFGVANLEQNTGIG